MHAVCINSSQFKEICAPKARRKKLGLREEYLEEITSQEGIREGFASGEGIKSGREKAEGISFWRELGFGSGKCRRELALIPSLRGG